MLYQTQVCGNPGSIPQNGHAPHSNLSRSTPSTGLIFHFLGVTCQGQYAGTVNSSHRMLAPDLTGGQGHECCFSTLPRDGVGAQEH